MSSERPAGPFVFFFFLDPKVCDAAAGLGCAGDDLADPSSTSRNITGFSFRIPPRFPLTSEFLRRGQYGGRSHGPAV